MRSLRQGKESPVVGKKVKGEQGVQINFYRTQY